ncbi:PREDICTED: myb family transcription factor EFM-like [Camelina sativa]|uniref:Myb family transcription factor EFM-like n=1 Tax=Camelina sativa TaxID=90675 RepID=A0ABM0TVL0_CAMSA|nr:PREDICTED: myb family transcription factor EFM-like [Camelina sativa]
MVQTETDQRMGLNLNLSIYSLPKPLSQFLDEVSRIDDNKSKLSEIDGYVGRLEEERKKIDVFKRELPLCMLLLNEAIGALQAEARKGSSVMASNGKFKDGEGAKLETDKKSWMSSAQLWISNPNSQFQSTNEKDDRCVTQNPFQTCNYPNQGGAFLPFNRPPPPPPPAPLSLMTPTSDMMMDCSRIEQNHHHHHHQFNKPSQLQSHHIQKKEQRRRWSQDLHRKFVDALHRLGGPQVATPKQIRDLMKVDGLTNDEVKSHLQKYRMHIRKHPLHPSKTLSSSDQPGVLERESQSLISLSRSDSPQSPLVARGLFSSNNGGHSSEEAEVDDDEEEEEEKSDGRSCRNETKKKRQVLDLEL